MNNEPYINIMVAVIEQAREDFMKWYKEGKANQIAQLIKEITSDYMAQFLPMKGEDIIKLWTAQAKGER